MKPQNTITMKSIMKKFAVIFLTIVLSSMFILWNFNMGSWDKFGRVMIVVISFFAAIIWEGYQVEERMKKEQK